MRFLGAPSASRGSYIVPNNLWVLHAADDAPRNLMDLLYGQTFYRLLSMGVLLHSENDGFGWLLNIVHIIIIDV
jgi:hypothetical protein